jgi:mono/diheme cytochrome c family protein
MTRRKAQLGLVCGVVLVSAAFAAGGWAVITVEDLPDAMTAGEPTELAFTIRQHGMEPMSDKSPILEARQGESRVRVPARREGAPGRYIAPLTLPRAGEWSITIQSGFRESQVTLLPMLATGPGSHPAPALSQHERGQRLYVAKGCVTCHMHAGIEDSGRAAVGPDLSEPRFDAAYLARVLDDPSILPQRTIFRMPDLDLKPHEIKALVAFLKRKSE